MWTAWIMAIRFVEERSGSDDGGCHVSQFSSLMEKIVVKVRQGVNTYRRQPVSTKIW